METKELVIRALIQKEDEQEFLLEYYIIDGVTPSGKLSHGIKIDMNHNNTLQTASALLPHGKEDIRSLIELYAKHFVMPISLEDLIEDL